MNRLPTRIWLWVTVALFLGAVMARLVYELTDTNSAGNLVVIALLILVTLGVYALLLYLTIKPSIKKLKSLPVRIEIIAIGTAALVDSIIHFIRFVPSPEAAASLPISIVIASLLLAGAISAYSLVLWIIWSVRKD